MGRTEITACLVLVLAVVLTQSQPDQDSRSLGNDAILSRVARQSELRVGVVELPPYVIIDQSKAESDQERYTGLTIDVLKKVAETVGFGYKIELQTDDLPGQKLANGTWDGLVGRLIKREVDLAGPLHITSDRQRVVDFTKPFVNTGISFLIQTPKRYEITQSLIFQPFSKEVWLTLLAAFLIISILFYTICRVSPYSNVRQQSVTKTNGFLSKITDSSAPFSIKNSFLYSINTLAFQGHRNTPKSWSARILSVFWAMFCLIMIIIYAANLSSFILAGRGSGPTLKFFDIDGVMASANTKIGIVKGRYEEAALKNMKNGVIDFTQRRGTFLESYSEGIRWLQSSYGNYALSMDTLAARYVALRHCTFRKFAKFMNTVGIGFAIPAGDRAGLSSQLNLAILQLHEDGTLTKLLNNWLKRGSKCYPEIDVVQPDPSTKSPIVAYTLTLKDMSSPLIFVFVGALIAIVVLVAEVIFVRCFSKKAEKTEETKLEENDGDITKEEVVVASP